MTDKCIVLEHLDRKTLSSAVYEAWYFQKLDEARRRKKAEVLKDQRKKEDFEKVQTILFTFRRYAVQMTAAD
jgi:polysaccharide pyruvyl transferase WcaK-like protein